MRMLNRNHFLLRILEKYNKINNKSQAEKNFILHISPYFIIYYRCHFFLSASPWLAF